MSRLDKRFRFNPRAPDYKSRAHKLFFLDLYGKKTKIEGENAKD